jgi:type II restriction/modification system DNA methylase subunit YeeA
VLELTEQEIKSVRQAARVEWSAVDPSIFGTLFERGLDPDTRAQLGAQYTSRADIETLIDPVVLAPLRREWEAARARVEELLAAAGQAGERARREREREARAAFRAFYERLAEVRVLDPACGSGNFLYVTLQRLKDLEKEALVFAADRGLGSWLPQVNPTQFYGIEVNPYAYDLAQTTLWIGYLQWITANGFGTPQEPILRPMENFENKDAILDLSDPAAPREPDWPAADFIVGNPPFLGNRFIAGELGKDYVSALAKVYKQRLGGKPDLVCYFFEKARKAIEEGKCKRAGFLATQGIRGGTNRNVLKRIKETGDIFFAESDRPWILNGASVHVSMVGFDNGGEQQKILDGQPVSDIHSNLTAGEDVTRASILQSNLGISFQGAIKRGQFDIDEAKALAMLSAGGNPHGKPNSDVIVPYVNALDITRGSRRVWIVDYGNLRDLSVAAMYAEPFEYLRKYVQPEVENQEREFWWLHWRSRPEMVAALASLPRFMATPRVAKHRLFVWLEAPSYPDSALIVFARSDDYFFGLLHSRIHEVWALKLGTRLETRPRYTPTTCFETFPFPEPTPEQEAAIASAARRLDELRRNWLNPPEWTCTDSLEFAGSTTGPWARYVQEPDERGVGTVRYPRTVARDEKAARELARRTLTNLYNQRPAWLAHAHAELDAAVAAAYDLPADLPDADILARLLELNVRRAR